MRTILFVTLFTITATLASANLDDILAEEAMLQQPVLTISPALQKTRAEIIGSKVEGKTVTAVETKDDAELTAAVTKLEQDIPDMAGYCETQYTQCVDKVSAWQEKLDEIKPYAKPAVVEEPIETPVDEVVQP